MASVNERQIAAYPAIRTWLLLTAMLVFLMVIVGGATRLTDSGLSITEWQPLTGALPPLSEADWLAAFERYKQFPEYQMQNRGMSLAEFKVIFWWEWGHRLLGRAIAVVFVLPLLGFLALRRISVSLFWKLLAILVLGGLQGALGWYMVASGLVNRVDVSQYRLAAHLTLAAFIFAAIVWTALGVGRERQWSGAHGRWGSLLLVVLILLQIAAGGFVAGLDAGMGYNTWPTMDGQWIPPGLLAMEPQWRNFFENALTVQFSHRLLAYLIMLVAIIHAWNTFSMSAMVVAYLATVQIGLGVATVVMRVPFSLGLVHQAGALIVLWVSIWHLHRKLLIQNPLLETSATKSYSYQQ